MSTLERNRKISALVEAKGNHESTQLCSWTLANCPSSIFKACVLRRLNEKSEKARAHANDQKAIELEVRLDLLAEQNCKLEDFIGKRFEELG